MGLVSDLNREIAAPVPHSRIAACGRRADAQLCQTAVDEIRDLVLEVGGVTEQEAELLLLVMKRLAMIQARSGEAAALRAAAAVRQTWLQMDED